MGAKRFCSPRRKATMAVQTERALQRSPVAARKIYRDSHAPELQRTTAQGVPSRLAWMLKDIPIFPSDAPRAFFEPRFDLDLSSVRVHTDGRAAQSAQSISAHAYTSDNDIVFGTGRYAPATQEGKRLLAHELTHVVQQRGGATSNLQRQAAAAGATRAACV